MKSRVYVVALFAIVFIVNSSFVAGKWERLGARLVNYSLDHDEIMVTGFEGKFEAVKIKVKGAPINMHKMVITFGNGGTQNVELKNNFKAGDESRVIDLTGDDRVIKKVSFWYDTKNYAKKRAEVILWGRH